MRDVEEAGEAEGVTEEGDEAASQEEDVDAAEEAGEGIAFARGEIFWISAVRRSAAVMHEGCSIPGKGESS